MGVTINDIARKANVSRTTVSRVLNNKPDVSSETRKKILKIIEKYNYHPSFLAKGTITKRSYTIGLIIPYDVNLIFDNPFYFEVIRGVLSEADITDYYILIISGTKSRDFISVYNEKRVEGFIILSPDANDIKLFNELDKNKIPYVATAKTPNTGVQNYVDVDNVKGASMAVEHLISLGHKRIAMIAGPEYLLSHKDRISGYRLVMSKNKLPVYDDYLHIGDNSFESGYKLTTQLLRLKEPPTAIFAAADMMAIGAIKAIKDSGYNVPQDISVVGFDDILQAQHVTPPLTTVRQFADNKGIEGCRLLIDFIENDSPICKKILPVELVVRESTMEI